MTVDEFKKKKKISPKRKSVLEPFKKEILQLHDEDISLKDIVEFLKSNNIKTTFQNVSSFIKRCQNEGLPITKNIVSKSKGITKIEENSDEKIEENSDEKIEDKSENKPKIFNVDIEKKVGKDATLEKPDWL